MYYDRWTDYQIYNLLEAVIPAKLQNTKYGAIFFSIAKLEAQVRG